MSTIHETAIIHESAKVDPTVEIGPYCVIGPETTIGARTRLMDHVTIESHTTMGTDNLVFPYSVIGSSPQDKKFSGEQSWCHIGNSNQIREHVTIHRGTGNGGGVTSIGDDNLIMVAAHIAHDCRVGNRSVIANQVMLAGHVHVGDALLRVVAPGPHLGVRCGVQVPLFLGPGDDGVERRVAADRSFPAPCFDVVLVG